MSTLGWRILLLVVAVRALPDPSTFSGSTNRERRHSDTSHLSDTELLCLLGGCDSTPPPGPTPGPKQGGGCTCAPVWQCRDNHVLPEVVSGTGDFLTQINVRTIVPCPTPEEVCCNDIDVTLEPITQPFSPTCGKRNTQGVVTSFQGFQNRQSQFGEFPWMAAIMTSELFGVNQEHAYIGGASLVHGQAVLTAAHYVDGKTASELAVRVGEWNFKEQSESMPHQDLRVREVLVHPNYIHSILAYDVALLILDQPAKLGHNVDTICLPPANYDFRDHKCVVSGWGKDIFSEAGKFQQILKSIELPPVDHHTCEVAMRGTRLGPGFHLDESFMCAGGERGKDACEGDGGSPLVCHKPGDPSKYYQAGVVSWGIGCGQDGVPGVYADVSKAVPWINTMLSERFGHDVRSLIK